MYKWCVWLSSCLCLVCFSIGWHQSVHRLSQEVFVETSRGKIATFSGNTGGSLWLLMCPYTVGNALGDYCGGLLLAVFKICIFC